MDDWNRQVGSLLEGWTPPRDLLFGVGSAGYQCEGGYNGKDQPQNQFAAREDQYQKSGPATRFWDARWRDDLDLTRGMGLGAFRMSIEWARVFPAGARERQARPAMDAPALDHYADIVLGAQQRGLEPILTLYHFTHPAWLGIDLWLRDDSAEEFLVFVDAVVQGLNRRLVDRGGRPIRWWITINEPNTYLTMTYQATLFPSDTFRGFGLSRSIHLVRATDHLYAAHVRAYDLIHRLYREAGWGTPSVGLNPIMLNAYGLTRAILDVLSARARHIDTEEALRTDLEARAKRFHERLEQLKRFGKTGLARAVASVVRRVGTLPVAKLHRLRQALRDSPHPCPMDYVGFDVYDPLLENLVWPPYSTVPTTAWVWRHYPEAVHESFHALAEIAPGLPVFLMENGMAVEHPLDGSLRPRRDGWTRDRFLREHIFHLLRAQKSGVPVTGYLHWSISDNYEWGSFSPRFGLHAVDYRDPERPRLPTDAAGTDAAGAYRAISGAIASGDSQRIFDAFTGQGSAAPVTATR